MNAVGPTVSNKPRVINRQFNISQHINEQVQGTQGRKLTRDPTLDDGVYALTLRHLWKRYLAKTLGP